MTSLVFACSVFSLHAGSICVTGGPCNANFQPFQTPIHHNQAPGPDGPMYFDGYSWDAPDANIAYYIEGQGAFQGSSVGPHAPRPYWGNPDGSAVTSFYFQSGGQAELVSFLAFQGLWAPYSSLGWYDPNSSAWGWILQADGTQPVPHVSAFNPTPNFGLFFVPDSLVFDPSRAYYTDSTRNGIAQSDVQYAAQNGITLGPEAYQHFAVFQNPNGVDHIGVNDRSNQVGDHDYNDMIFELVSVPSGHAGSLNPVPEPSFFPLTAGLLAILLMFRGRISRYIAGH